MTNLKTKRFRQTSPISPLDQPGKRSLYYFWLLGTPLLNWWLVKINFFSRAACFCNLWSCRLLIYTCKRWSYGYIAPSVSFLEARGMNVIKLKFSRFRWQSQSNQCLSLWLGRNGYRSRDILGFVLKSNCGIHVDSCIFYFYKTKVMCFPSMATCCVGLWSIAEQIQEAE